MTPTAQQRAIIDRVRSGCNLAVNAGPGTGKTATNGMVAKASTDKNIVNFCFNRSTKLQADQKMPAHVKNYTFHGAAYAQIGKYYAGKLNIKLQPNVIAGRFGCDARTAMLAKYTLRRYALSDDGAIMGWHVPREAVLAVDEKDRNAFKDEIVTLAKKTWYACMNHKDRLFGIEHDFYLKQWVEEGARLPGKFQLGLVDEAQDMVPINIKAINKMRFEQTVLTGDPKQELYLWRGGQDAMRAMGYDELPLTLSHRFGPAIADVANQVIDLFPEKHHHLTGDTKIDSSICHGAPSDPHVVLCRSNAGLLGETVNAVRKGKRIHVVGSIFDSILLMESAWYLSIGDKAKVKHPTMAMIGDWNAALELATEDTEIAQAVKRVDEYGGQIPSLVDELRCAGETSRDRADVVLSTVHKFKGDEADVVKLGDDFPDLVRWSKKDRAYIPLKGELCVFFVAVTRARRKLYANRTLEQLKVWKELL
jgi:hypothetical protein